VIHEIIETTIFNYYNTDLKILQQGVRRSNWIF